MSTVPVISEEKVETVMDFLLQMTRLISELGVEKTKQVELNKGLRESENELQAANQKLNAQNQQLQTSEQTLKKQTHKLGERIHELNCLTSISKVVKTRETMEDILRHATKVIPPNWQYPEITCLKITLGDKEYKTENYKDSHWKLSSDIMVNKKIAGKIEVCYLEKKPERDIGPFLNEESFLLDTIAKQLGQGIAGKNAEESLQATNQKLHAIEQQLRVTIEQLTASEEKYRLLFQKMLNGFAYHQIVTDKNGKASDYIFMEINDAFEELTSLNLNFDNLRTTA